MKRLHYFLTLMCFLLCNTIYAQVGINTRTPDPSAALDITGSGKGVLIPRMKFVERPASPVSGLLIYQTDNTPGFYYFTGTKWQMLNGSGFNDTLTQNLYTNGFWLSGDGQDNGIYLQGNGLMLDTGNYNSGPDLAIGGAGTRMLWYPKKSAFRAGTAAASEWNNNNIGNYSTAFGYGTSAPGNYATALGNSNNAAGTASAAMGSNNTATGNNAWVAGSFNSANGANAFAAGNRDTASGTSTVAMGSYVSTNNHNGSFIFGDNSTTTATQNDADNQLKTRFSGGYKLYTDAAATKGFEITPSGLLKYINNVAGIYDSLSVVDKHYVDSLIIDAYTWVRNVNTNGHFLSGDGSNTGVYMLPNGIMVDSGAYNTGADLSIGGAGTRMMWYPKKAAFRSGGVNNTQWDNSNIGDYSSAFGFNNIAGAYAATVTGSNNNVTGANTLVTGSNNIVSSGNALVAGNANTVNGTSAFAAGDSNTASGINAVVAGNASVAAGENAFALGNNNTANGSGAAAMGSYMSTNGHNGSFGMGDNSTTTPTLNDADNQMQMRFAGGYKLYTDPATSKGLQITSNGVLKYFTNVGANYDSLSVVDKSYVDSMISDAYTWTKNVNSNGHFLSGDGSNTGIYMLTNGLMVDTGTINTGTNLAITGAGTRMIWYPKKAAFRAGALSASPTYWDDNNIGQYSASLGLDNKVTGYVGMAFGQNNIVGGQQNFAAGFQNSATGASSVALGVYCNSTGSGSAAIGYQNTASANGATALGEFTFATALCAFASGNTTTASGQWSTAMGRNVSTNGKHGSFIFGDTASTGTNNDAYNQMLMRFKGGFKLYDNATANQGLLMDDGSMVQTGTFGSGTDLATAGPGTRMIWNDKKGAFRAGVVDGTQWNNTSIGNYSSAMGQNTVATGIASFALGQNDAATGDDAVAMGYYCNATNWGAVAMGLNSLASGQNSFATGQNDTASGNASAVLGSGNVASGGNAFVAGSNNRATANFATALGRFSNATGFASAVIGLNDTASGTGSFALGSYVSTNSKFGSFALGDNSTTIATRSSAVNQMMMRFAGGYQLYTDASATIGVQIAASGNSWATISDVRKKENFAAINGEDILHKISKFNLTSWNYKGQNPKLYRHYGPMAQDFYAAFGKDKYGVIGNDTTIGQADMEGISFTAIQALEKRTQQLQQDNDKATAEISTLRKENQDIQLRMAKMEKEFADRMEQVETAVVKQRNKNKVAIK